MIQFDIPLFISQIFWLISTIGGLYFFVYYFVVPNAECILAMRKRVIDSNITHAEKSNNMAKKLYLEKQNRVAEMNIQVEDMHKKAMQFLDQYFTKQKQKIAINIDLRHKESLPEIKNYINQFRKDEGAESIRLASCIIYIATNKPVNIRLITEMYSRLQ